MTINAINFGQLYRDHVAAAGGREKPAAAWDARAANMANSVNESPYTQAFINRMDLQGCESLLDVGCGAGAIGLALASRLKKVVGVDYSRGMLDLFVANAKAAGLNNTQIMQRAWEDDWQDVPVCDVVVASRSTAVIDMADALQKLDSKAAKRVYLTNLVGGSFIDRGLLDVLGRPAYSMPDFIYILNILYQMGRYPRLDYIAAQGRLAGTQNIEEFLAKVTLALGELTESEQQRLTTWYHADPQRAALGGAGLKWALVSWQTQPSS